MKNAGSDKVRNKGVKSEGIKWVFSFFFYFLED